MSAPTMDEAAKLLADPLTYTDEQRLHAALTHLRGSAPVSWVDVPNYRAVLGDHEARGRHGHRT